MKASAARLLAPLIMLQTADLWAEGREQLTISVGDWPPFFVEHEPGQGSVARLVRDIFDDQGYDVSFEFLPWKRAYRDAATGKHDATAIWMYAEDRESDFVYSDAVMQERFVLFHRADQEIQWETLSDLAELTLGASIGYSYGPEFDLAVENGLLTIEWAASTELNFNKLLYGRIDAFPEEINVGYYILRRETGPDETAKITHNAKPILENESFLLFPRDKTSTPRLREAFNRGLRKFRETGRYHDYFSTRPQSATLTQPTSASRIP